MSKHAFTVVVAVVIAVSLLLYLFAFQVRSSEVAVVLTFGKAGLTSPEPGPHFQWPWPIQEVRHFDNRLHVQDGRLEETRTRDGFNVITSVCVGWRIGSSAEDVAAFNRNFGRSKDPSQAGWESLDKTIRDKTLQVLGRHDLGEFVSVKSDQLKYDDIETEIRKAAAEQATRNFGIDVPLLKIKRLELPDSVKQQVYARMAAERAKETQNITSSGDELAARIRAEAESERDQILAKARSEAERLRGEGDAGAAKFYGVFAANPELAIYLREVRALQKVAQSNTTIIVDTSTPPFNLLNQGPPEQKGSTADAAK